MKLFLQRSVHDNQLEELESETQLRDDRYGNSFLMKLSDRRDFPWMEHDSISLEPGVVTDIFVRLNVVLFNENSQYKEALRANISFALQKHVSASVCVTDNTNC